MLYLVLKKITKNIHIFLNYLIFIQTNKISEKNKKMYKNNLLILNLFIIFFFFLFFLFLHFS